jgi:hypothetical protein
MKQVHKVQLNSTISNFIKVHSNLNTWKMAAGCPVSKCKGKKKAHTNYNRLPLLPVAEKMFPVF